MQHNLVLQHNRKEFNLVKKIIKIEWRAPKFLVRPKKGPTMLESGSNWNLVPLPASSTKGGERGMLKASGLDQEEGQFI
jgi:hypothetical protein